MPPKLFSSCLVIVFHKNNWVSGVAVNDKLLNFLLFAVDKVFNANNYRELEEVLEEFKAQSNEVSLMNNADKKR